MEDTWEQSLREFNHGVKEKLISHGLGDAAYAHFKEFDILDTYFDKEANTFCF